MQGNLRLRQFLHEEPGALISHFRRRSLCVALEKQPHMPPNASSVLPAGYTSLSLSHFFPSLHNIPTNARIEGLQIAKEKIRGLHSGASSVILSWLGALHSVQGLPQIGGYSVVLNRGGLFRRVCR